MQISIGYVPAGSTCKIQGKSRNSFFQKEILNFNIGMDCEIILIYDLNLMKRWLIIKNDNIVCGVWKIQVCLQKDGYDASGEIKVARVG